MKKTLPMIINIVCAVLLVATFASMMIPCWDFVAEEKIKVKTCRVCGLAVELSEGEEDLPEDYVCPGTKLVDPNAPVEEEEPVEQTEATEATEATEGVVIASAVTTTAAVVETTAATEAATEATEAATEATEPVTLVEAPCGATGKKSFKTSTTKITYDDSASPMEYVWLAFNNKGLTADFEEQGYKINDLILAPFLLTVCVIAGVIACLMNMKGTWQSFFPLIGGAATVYTYLSFPIMQCGTWMVSLGLGIALTVAGLALFTLMMIKVIKWFTVPCYKK